VLRRWAPRRGPVEAPFTVESADEGYRFDVRTEGEWHRTGRHRDPAAAAARHVIDEVARLASTCSILAPAELEYRANACLGRPVDLPEAGVRLMWAAVHVHVAPDDLHDARAHLRARARARAAHQEQQLRIAQAVAYRDLLREDPTLALAQMLLENPTAVNGQTATLVEQLSQCVATYAPGAAWVETAQVLQESFGNLAPDAKQFVVDRFCTALTEFGQKRAAQRIRQAHGFTETAPVTPAEPPVRPGLGADATVTAVR